VRENAALEDDKINLAKTKKLISLLYYIPKTRGLLLRQRSLGKDEGISGSQEPTAAEGLRSLP